MNQNILGKTEISISEIGLGTWEISGNVWGKKDDTESVRAINIALDAGVNFIDTAAGYGNGHSEEIIGRALRESKIGAGRVVVSTKVLPKCRKWSPPPERDIDDFFPPDWIIQQCDESLKRLQVEQIGILFLHTWSSSWAHRTEWYEAMIQLKQQGKINAVGISISDERIDEANVHVEANRVDVIQCVYNIFQQEPEYNLLPLARKKQVGIVARSPFSSGALIGNWISNTIFPEGDWRNSWPKRVGKDNWLQEQVEMAEMVKPILTKEGISMPIAALKFILMNDSITSVIPGSANPEHLKINISASAATALSTETMQALKQLWLDRKIHGTYNGSI